GSSASGGRRGVASAAVAARASGLRSWTAWCAPTAARSRPPTPRAGAPSSPCGCRRSEPAPLPATAQRPLTALPESAASMQLMHTPGAQLLATAAGPHLFWITSRAAGTAALILSSLSVCVGLSMGGRLLRGRRIDLRVVHEALSLAAVA